MFKILPVFSVIWIKVSTLIIHTWSNCFNLSVFKLSKSIYIYIILFLFRWFWNYLSGILLTTISDRNYALWLFFHMYPDYWSLVKWHYSCRNYIFITKIIPRRAILLLLARSVFRSEFFLWNAVENLDCGESSKPS